MQSNSVKPKQQHQRSIRSKTPQASKRRRRKHRRAENALEHRILGPPKIVAGILETHPDGYGFLRSAVRNWKRDPSDPYVPCGTIDSLGLRAGDMLEAQAHASTESNGPAVTRVLSRNSRPVEVGSNVIPFEDQTPISPRERLRLETTGGPMTTRVVDLLTPVGKGQRALIVAPPRTGKTTILRDVAKAVASNYPDVHLAILLVDERPEEVTDFRLEVPAEYFASNLDQPFADHVRMASLAIERCKRLAESGQDVVLVVDSLTRLARASNKTFANGPIAQGGLRIRALEFPKSIFGAARAFREGGSLTVIATALVGTNSNMDEAIFQEFKGTGNLEVVLELQLADRGIWPALNLTASRTRNEALLYTPEEMEAAQAIRRTFAGDDPLSSMQRLTRQLDRFASNQELVALVNAASAK